MKILIVFQSPRFFVSLVYEPIENSKVHHMEKLEMDDSEDFDHYIFDRLLNFVLLLRARSYCAESFWDLEE